MTHQEGTRDAMTVIGIEIRTSNEDAHEIGALWGRFVTDNLAAEVPGRVDDATVAVYCEYESDHTGPYTFLLGCAVAPNTVAPEGMTRREVPGGSFVQYTAEGPMPQALMNTWAEIWNAALDRAFGSDYEIHPADDTQPTLVLVGTRPKS